MDQNNVLESGGFYFIYNFDSGNLGHVERVPTELIAPSVTSQKNVPAETPDYEFNLWTRPDCAGTEFENGNRTWFYFGVQASEPNVLVRLNLINLNKQGKMYAQGMAPVTRTLPGKPQWERIRDRPVHNTDDNAFTLSFKYRTCENTKATTFFAFTYPFSFAELQIALNSIDMKMLPVPPPQSPDDIYYHRECLIYSLEGRRVDLLTISSHHGLSTEREERLKNLFPEKQERPFKFPNKKVIFVSARVHPGETPSSFVFNGFLNLLLNRNDPIAIQLRKVYVFKMIPFLNPDGVARGHYRTDTRGVNLNRVYLNPSLTLHPTVYASRALIRFYHYGCEKEDSFDDAKSYTSRSIQNISESAEKKRGQSSNLKRDKAKFAAGNKSSTTLCQPSDNSKRNSSYKLRGEAGALVEQVYDMSIRESAACEDHQASIRDERRADDGSSLLTEQLLRSCLGSGVRLSASGELDAHGPSPLRPLRDTLKNSISLLMGSTSSVGGDSLNEKESRLSNVRMGWCAQCRAAIARLEQAAPPAPPAQPAPHSPRSQTAMREGQEHTYSSIDEYREYQKKQFEEAMVLSSEAGAAREEGAVYFCTNCFKRYTIAPNNEEISCDTVPAAGGVAVSAGDSGCIRCEPHPALTNVSTGDTLPPLPSKDEKPKQKIAKKKSPPMPKPAPPSLAPSKETDSGLYLYLDLHGHASKKGIFMYGNHFDDVESCVECMLLPRVMSLNNLHFHFSSCNFTERNMYLKDRRDGMSREGSGRVAVLKATGLVRSYTLECNYNTGRLVNVLPPTVRDGPAGCQLSSSAPMPPKYTPHIFEETPSIATGENTSLAPIMASSKTNSIQTTDTANSNTLSHQNKIGRAVTNFPRNTTRPMSAGSRTNSYKEKTLDRHRQFNNSNSKNTSRPQSATSKTNNNPVNFTSIEKAWDPEKRLRAPDQNSSVRTRSSTLGAHSSNASYNTLMEKVRYVRPRYSQNLNLSLEFLEEINPMEVGRSLGASILDLTGQHPNSRIPCSEHRNITSVREWLRAHTKTMRPQITMPRIRPKTASPPRQPLYPRKGKVDERKENAYRADIERPRAAPAPAAPLAPRGNRSPDEPKRSLAAKRRNVLGIRKPHASKTHVPAKPRRAAPDASVARLGKRAFRPPRPRAIASSSSSSADAHWEEVAGGTALQALPPRRRPASNPPHPKKIRLKASL